MTTAVPLEPAALPSTEASLGARLTFTALPIGVTFAVLGVVGVLHGWHVASQLVAFMAASFFGLGKFAVFAGAAAHATQQSALVADLAGIVGLHPGDPRLAFYIAGLVTYMDLVTAMLVAYNLDWSYHLPLLGPRLRELARSSAEIAAAFPWIRRTAFFGCMAFVAFPVSGTGAIGGTMLGRLMGFSHARTLAAIALGALIGTYSLAFAAYEVGANLDWLRQRGDIAVGVLAVFASFFIWLNWIVRARVKMLRRLREVPPDVTP